jgi:hypothetical protein
MKGCAGAGGEAAAASGTGLRLARHRATAARTSSAPTLGHSLSKARAPSCTYPACVTNVPGLDGVRADRFSRLNRGSTVPGGVPLSQLWAPEMTMGACPVPKLSQLQRKFLARTESPVLTSELAKEGPGSGRRRAAWMAPRWPPGGWLRVRGERTRDEPGVTAPAALARLMMPAEARHAHVGRAPAEP